MSAAVSELQEAPNAQIMFNYMGRMDLSGTTEQPWSLLTGAQLDALPVATEPDLPLRFALYINVLVGATPDGLRTDDQLAVE